MSDLYLIAHSVRGEAAFDVAMQMECPHCQGNSNKGREPYVCFDCDDKGWWWIIPTSGHRAFPYWHCRLDECLVMGMGEYEAITYGILNEMPPVWPDHYKTNATVPEVDIKSLFKAQREAKPHIPRRL